MRISACLSSPNSGPPFRTEYSLCAPVKHPKRGGYSVRNRKLSIPDGYVLNVFEAVFFMIIIVFFSVISFWCFEKIVKIPSTPKKVVLESAVIHKGLWEASKTTSYLYLRVGQGDDEYDYVIEASSRDVQYLDLSRSRKLWVAVEPDRSKRFVWGVYNSELELLISRQDILMWALQNNISNYFIIFTWSIGSLYLLFLIFRNGIWNRFLAKRIARENRAG